MSDQSNLTEMISSLQSSNNNKTFSSFIFMKFQTIARPWLYDIEFLSFITFSYNCFTFEVINGLETIDQLQLLEFIKTIKEFDLIKESSFLGSSVDAGFYN